MVGGWGEEEGCMCVCVCACCALVCVCFCFVVYVCICVVVCVCVCVCVCLAGRQTEGHVMYVCMSLCLFWLGQAPTAHGNNNKQNLKEERRGRHACVSRPPLVAYSEVGEE